VPADGTVRASPERAIRVLVDRAVHALADHPFRYAVLSLLLCAISAWAGYGTGIEGLQAVTRYTGRAGLVWFSVIFLLAARHRFADAEKAQGGLRILLGFGLHHTVHLVLLLSYLNASGHPLILSRAAGGMVGYLALFAMMATSSIAARERLGNAGWQAFHQVALWYLWIVFVLTYVPRVLGKAPNVGGGPFEFYSCLSLLVMLAAMRVRAFAKARIHAHPSARA
jgi:DMSO/TMAO reductase YedYZ heme-binding membrane subunit